jgi:hypothetical protein
MHLATEYSGLKWAKIDYLGADGRDNTSDLYLEPVGLFGIHRTSEFLWRRMLKGTLGMNAAS